MKECRLQMGMPITVEILDADVTADDIEAVYAYFTAIDERFSTYKDTSEISRINRGELQPEQYSGEMQTVLALAAQTKTLTHGYFEIARDGQLDPSGLVKGWAIQQAAQRLKKAGWRNFYVDAGGDIQVAGTKDGRPWRVGIRNPRNRREIVKVLAIAERGVATSGTAIRGQHIYNPLQPGAPLQDVLSITVVGPNVYEADRFATAAFAMGKQGIQFIESLPECEGYMIDADARATYTSGLERYVVVS